MNVQTSSQTKLQIENIHSAVPSYISAESYVSSDPV